MPRYPSFVIVLLVETLFTSCATGRLQLSSLPEDSSVQLISNRGDIKFLGKTPLALDLQCLFLNSSDFAMVPVEKDGSFSQSFVIPRSSLPAYDDISISLDQKPGVKIPAPPATPVAVEMDKCSQLSKENLTRLRKIASIYSPLSSKINEFQLTGGFGMQLQRE